MYGAWLSFIQNHLRLPIKCSRFIKAFSINSQKLSERLTQRLIEYWVKLVVREPYLFEYDEAFRLMLRPISTSSIFVNILLYPSIFCCQISKKMLLGYSFSNILSKYFIVCLFKLNSCALSRHKKPLC